MKYTVGPAFIKGPWRSLTTSYGIGQGEVYSRRTFFGVKRGGPTVPVEGVTRTHAEGVVVGDVVFGEGSHNPVVWRDVLFPQRKLRKARAVLAEIKRSTEPSVVTRKRTTPIAVSHATTDELERHRADFRSLPEDRRVRTHARSSPPSRVTMVRTWNASHSVPERGDGKRVNPPSVLAWTKDGTALAIAGDAFGATSWTVHGERVGGGTLPQAYGTAIRVCASDDGRFTLLEGMTGRNRWLTIQSGSEDFARRYCLELPLWGSYGMWDSALERLHGFSPWRAGTTQIVVSPSWSTLEVLDVRELPEENNHGDFPEVIPHIGVDLGNVDARATSVARYHLHPGGDYVATTICDESDQRTSYRIVFVHLPTGRIFASIPRCVMGMGWSPSGREYLYSRWQSPNTDDWRRELCIWDSNRWESRPVETEEMSLPWIAPRKDFDLDVARQETCNADGTVVLSESGELRSRNGRAEPLGLVPRFAYAAWSPSDPSVFASVGGEDAPCSVRIWRIE